ncbi:hypothetical protein B0O80DRAFT_500371 [Mortierella sp. GBAus27b]|nr:hypothetical protein BGX31_001390 [Mortierella sp. GBA43]KAI8351032.1 hypothetical protein B0O80DRAFT_500371 [Mortierella sp. GBAus27b]
MMTIEDQDITSHEWTDDGSSSGDEYPNPFQHQRYYNVAVPAIEHWPDLLSHGLKASVRSLRWIFRQIKDAIRELCASEDSSSWRYQDLPMTVNGSFSEPSSRGRVSFGKRRHLYPENGFPRSCPNRRLGRLLCLLIAATIIVTILLLPARFQPFHERVAWIRYFNHEEAVKVVLPFGRNVHVQDVKKIAVKEMGLGAGSTQTLGNIRLLSPMTRNVLPGDMTWDSYIGWSSPEIPIIAVEPRYELLKFLNETLGCFSGPEAYGGNIMDVKFLPQLDGYGPLITVLQTLLHGHGYSAYNVDVYNRDIDYLRRGFDDPKKDEQLDMNKEWAPRRRLPPPRFVD